MEEFNKANQIINQCSQNKIYNFCGNISINQSAYLIKHSQFLLSNDTGLMHIGAALNKKIISFWGCTKPDLGFYPYTKKSNSLMIISELSKRQCSKHGSSCRFTFDGCVKKINPKEILEKVTQFIS
jgi:ADP-heptose:LPS heptosyltransferase